MREPPGTQDGAPLSRRRRWRGEGRGGARTRGGAGGGGGGGAGSGRRECGSGFKFRCLLKQTRSLVRARSQAVVWYCREAEQWGARRPWLHPKFTSPDLPSWLGAETGVLQVLFVLYLTIPKLSSSRKLCLSHLLLTAPSPCPGCHQREPELLL